MLGRMSHRTGDDGTAWIHAWLCQDCLDGERGFQEGYNEQISEEEETQSQRQAVPKRHKKPSKKRRERERRRLQGSTTSMQ